ncbi:hypothetical protein BS50DRAFT_186259 [Corynespora cassiicola Philippines]|uniref:Uncharacterized protein n=1 Tax=Corynespora cassiicola Philippines TaxID=1448308 RepID=A0A2T2P6U6_CORCC|nr:hypothetical protein BS50DRAFT_186259 [Corynespora cassiicola Philippines]
MAPKPTPLSPLPPGTTPITRKDVIYHLPTTPSHTTPLKSTILLPRNSAWQSGLHFHAQHTEYLRLARGCIFVHHGTRTVLLSAAAGGVWAQNRGTGDDLEGEQGRGREQSDGSTAGNAFVVRIPPYTRHNWGRAEAWMDKLQPGGDWRERERARHLPEDIFDDVVVEEWVGTLGESGTPSIDKALFFWNLNGILVPPERPSAAPKLGVLQRVAKSALGDGGYVELQLFVVFHALDNWPVLIPMEGCSNPILGVIPMDGFERGFEWVVTFVVLSFAGLIGWLIGLHAVAEDRTPEELWTVRQGKRKD